MRAAAGFSLLADEGKKKKVAIAVIGGDCFLYVVSLPITFERL